MEYLKIKIDKCRATKKDDWWWHVT